MTSKLKTKMTNLKTRVQSGGKEKVTKQKVKDNTAAVIPNPISFIPTDDLEADVAIEAGLMKQALRDADKRIAEEAALQNDTEYFFVVMFEDRVQKEIFLKAMNWLLMGDKYVDGTLVARQMNIPLPKVELKKEKGNPRKMFTALVDPNFD